MVMTQRIGAAVSTGSASRSFKTRSGRKASIPGTVGEKGVRSNAASSLVGKWTATFDTQVGQQVYVYTIENKDEKLLGNATMKLDGKEFRSELLNFKVEGTKIQFEEKMKFNEIDLAISYTGQWEGDQLKLTRRVGDFGTEELVATRVP